MPIDYDVKIHEALLNVPFQSKDVVLSQDAQNKIAEIIHRDTLSDESSKNLWMYGVRLNIVGSYHIPVIFENPSPDMASPHTCVQ